MDTIFREGQEELDRLAREVARLEGVSVAEAVRRSLERERQAVVESQDDRRHRIDQALRAIRARPVIDDRPVDKLLYDESGLPI